ncbi:hypothetical protein BY458DRAFT_510124 [Sporodiniella umbellata]|nr:hypothetical protein BY458DRAFT_510124 [Sporodiniella umbellata]
MISPRMDIASYPTDQLIKMVSDLLEAILKSNRSIPSDRVTHFHSKTIPNIAILAYLTRIHRFVPFENEALLSILIYFDRFTELDPHFYLNAYNVHRLLITR